jgi:hypothetical protein
MVALLAAALGAGASNTAQAAQLPQKFEPNKHVLVVPEWNLDTSANSDRLRQEADKQKLELYLVYTVQAYTMQGKLEDWNNLGQREMTRLRDMWKADSRFPSERFLLIVVVRSRNVNSGNNQYGYSVGIDIGSGPRRYGMSDARLTQSVQAAGRKFLPGNPQGFAAEAVSQINQQIASLQSAAAQPQQRPATPATAQPSQPSQPRQASQPPAAVSQGQGASWLLWTLLVLALVGGAGFLVWRFLQQKALKDEATAALDAAKKKWDPVLSNAAEGLKRMDEYSAYLKGEAPYQGETRKQLEPARKAWSQFESRYYAAHNVRKHAGELEARGDLGSLTEAVALLTTRKMVITGDDLPREKWDLLGGFEFRDELSGEQVIDLLVADFATTSKAVSEVAGSIRTARKNGEGVELSFKGGKDEDGNEVVSIEALRTKLEAAGLAFAPYKERCNSVRAETEAFLALLGKDPVTARAQSEETRKKLDALKKDLSDAVTLQSSLGPIEKEIDTARATVNSAREKMVDWKLPNELGGAQVKFAFAEQGRNPDTSLSLAGNELPALKEAIGAGQIAEARKHAAAARAAANEAVTAVTGTLTDKASLEDELPAVLERTASGADDDFLAKIKSCYFAQNFRAARSAMRALKQLMEERTNAKEVVERLAALWKDVSRSYECAVRVVSDGTSRSYRELVSQVQDCSRAAASDQVDNPAKCWPNLAQRATSLEKAVQDLKKSIEGDVNAQTKASEDVGALRRTYDECGFEQYMTDRRITPVTAGKLAELKKCLVGYESQITEPNGNWAKLSGHVGFDLKKASQLKDEVKEDLAKYESFARQQQEFDALNAKVYTRSVNGRVYGGIRADSPQALQYQRAAEEHRLAAEMYYRERDWARYEAEMQSWRQSYTASDLLTWYLVLDMMRQSNDHYAQRYAYEMGYRDGAGWDSWRDRYVARQPASTGDFWEPAPVETWRPSTQGGGADFNNSPDFSGSGGSDPWTPAAPKSRSGDYGEGASWEPAAGSLSSRQASGGGTGFGGGGGADVGGGGGADFGGGGGADVGGGGGADVGGGGGADFGGGGGADVGGGGGGSDFGGGGDASDSNG